MKVMQRRWTEERGWHPAFSGTDEEAQLVLMFGTARSLKEQGFLDEMRTMNKDRIHLLLIDVIMPRKSGKDVYEEIKKIKPDIKTLFISGHTANTIHRKGVLEEGKYFIQTPALSDNLLKKIRAVLDQ